MLPRNLPCNDFGPEQSDATTQNKADSEKDKTFNYVEGVELLIFMFVVGFKNEALKTVTLIAKQHMSHE